VIIILADKVSSQRLSLQACIFSISMEDTKTKVLSLLLLSNELWFQIACYLRLASVFPGEKK
jgi:hypothetical protein